MHVCCCLPLLLAVYRDASVLVAEWEWGTIENNSINYKNLLSWLDLLFFFFHLCVCLYMCSNKHVWINDFCRGKSKSRENKFLTHNSCPSLTTAQSLHSFMVILMLLLTYVCLLIKLPYYFNILTIATTTITTLLTGNIANKNDSISSFF